VTKETGTRSLIVLGAGGLRERERIRKADQRRRWRAGLIGLRIEVDECALANALIESGRLNPEESEDRDALALEDALRVRRRSPHLQGQRTAKASPGSEGSASGTRPSRDRPGPEPLGSLARRSRAA
jgi:hypothetical protein